MIYFWDFFKPRPFRFLPRVVQLCFGQHFHSPDAFQVIIKTEFSSDSYAMGIIKLSMGNVHICAYI